MSVVIYTKNTKQSNAWYLVLQEELPEYKIEIYPSVEDFNSVKFLVCWKPPHGLIAKFPNLQAIQSLGAGVDHIFESNTIDSKIQVSKIVDDQLTHDMWEHTLSIVLNDMKNLTMYQAQQAQSKWKARRYKRMKDVSIGVLGMGTIGKYVAKNFANLGYRVLGWSKSPKEIEGVYTMEGEKGMKQICHESDYLINILPLTKATKGILNRKFFAVMKSDAFIINVGRGQHLVDEDLIEALDTDMIRGASLDVFQEEPLPETHPFWTHSKIQITPHIASLTHIKSVYPQVVDNIKRVYSNKSILNYIDTEKGY